MTSNWRKYYARDREYKNAVSRAHTKLRNMYPQEFRRLLDEELPDDWIEPTSGDNS